MAQSTIPEGHGKAEAMRTFLARGGGLTRLGKFKDGPMKGMTMQQAQTMFESKWTGASGQVKDKYAGIARNVLTPAEDAASAQNQKPTPFSPPSGPTQRLFQEHPAESKFLAANFRLRFFPGHS